MPTMANITVKAANGATDVVYDQMSPAGGDGVWAIWRSAAIVAIAAAKPVLRLMSKWNGDRKVRRVEGQFEYPYTVLDSTTGVTSVRKVATFYFSAMVPMDIPSAILDEMAAQGSNLAASALIKSCVSSGYGPT